MEEETGAHQVFSWEEGYGLRLWNWTSWEELNDQKVRRYTVEGEGGEVVVGDQVEDFMVALDRAMLRVA